MAEEDKALTSPTPSFTKALHFARPELEQSYVTMLNSSDTQQFQLPTFSVRLSVFCGSFALLYFLQLSHFLARSPSDDSLTVQLSISLAGLLAGLIFVPVLILCEKLRMGLICAVYVLAVVAFSGLDFGAEEGQIPAFLPTLALGPSLQGLAYYRTPVVLVLTTLGGLVNFAFKAGVSETAYPLFPLGIYTVCSVALAYNCYLLELRIRKDFSSTAPIQPIFRRQATIHPELQEGAVGTELEAVISQLWKVQSYLKDAVFVARTSAEKERASKNVGIVKELLVKLRSKNIYAVTTENLPRVWDVEETKYVQENYMSQTGLFMELRRENEVQPTVPKTLKSSVKSLIPLLSQIGSQWNIDTDSLNVWATGKPIRNVATYLFKSFHLHRTVAFRKAELATLFTEIEERYLPNPYHNSVHATDVTISLMYLVKSSGLLAHSTDLEIAALITAGLAHDVAHPGVNNRFLQNSKDKLAIECKSHADNDVSILEMMHLSILFNLFESTRAAEGLSFDVWMTFRKIVIELVLATDMSKHLEMVGVLRTMIAPVNVEDAGTRLSLFRILLKCADIGHSAKSWDLHERWSLRISEEFFRQGDSEKAKGLPVSVYCDRSTTEIAKVLPT